MKKTTIILTVMLTLAFLAPGLYFYAEDQIEAEVLTTIFAALATVIGVMWTHTLAKKREIAEREFANKRSSYGGLLDFIFDLFTSVKKDKPIDIGSELITRMINIKKDLLTWADIEVIRAWNDVETISSQGGDAKQVLGKLDALLRAIRKDLGKEDWRIKEGELFSLMLAAEEKESFS